MSALVHPPPSILVTGDVDPPPASTRHQSLNRSLGGIYEELGPPSAPPPPPAGVFRSGSNTNYLVPRADAGQARTRRRQQSTTAVLHVRFRGLIWRGRLPAGPEASRRQKDEQLEAVRDGVDDEIVTGGTETRKKSVCKREKHILLYFSELENSCLFFSLTKRDIRSRVCEMKIFRSARNNIAHRSV